MSLKLPVRLTRNDIVHSHVHFSLDGSKHAFRHHKKGEVDASEAAVNALVGEAKEVTLLILECWIGFNHRFDALYTQTDQS
jgi:hypothetical protein